MQTTVKKQNNTKKQTRNEGKFKFGYIKKTNNQVKKHVSQMTDKEKSRILRNVKQIPNLYLGGHVFRKVEEDGLSFEPIQIVEVLRDVKKENIIEYNRTKRYDTVDNRVVLRSTKNYLVDISNYGAQECNLCFVLSTVTGRIITVYWNKAEDSHDSIRMSRYDANLQVI